MSEKATVFDAFLQVQTAVEAIGKTRRVTEGPARFAFRGVDDVMAALHEPMSQAGLICVPQVMERLQETRATRNGGAMNVTHVRVRFAFYGPDGSSFHAETWGEGQDSGDKSTGKAHSMAYKSALLQAFHIPVDEGTPDADYDTTPAAPRQTDPALLADLDAQILVARDEETLKTIYETVQAAHSEGRLTDEDRALLVKAITVRKDEVKP